MDAEKIKEKIEYYFDEDMMFSALFYCEQLLKTEQGEYWHFKYADILRLCGFHAKSQEVYFRIDVEKIPDNYRYLYHLYLGQLFVDMRDVESAKAEFEKCMQFENCDTTPFIYIASLLSGEENSEKAIWYLEQALDKKGDVDEVCYHLATRYAIRGQFGKALTAVENCLKLDPNYPNAVTWKKDLLERIALEEMCTTSGL